MKWILFVGCAVMTVLNSAMPSRHFLLWGLLIGSALLHGTFLHELGCHSPMGYEDENGFHIAG